MAAELGSRLVAFQRTSTLQDDIDPQTAESIFLLGEYFVLLNKSHLVYQLQRASERATEWARSRAQASHRPNTTAW